MRDIGQAVLSLLGLPGGRFSGFIGIRYGMLFINLFSDFGFSRF